jgi:hypothetical protein
VISRLDSSHHARLAPNRRTGRYIGRGFDRRKIDGVATMFELSGDRFGLMHTATTIDYSEGEMSALSDDLVPPGATVSVGFQSPECTSRHGQVVRCMPCDRGYRVVVAFQPQGDLTAA